MGDKKYLLVIVLFFLLTNTYAQFNVFFSQKTEKDTIFSSKLPVSFTYYAHTGIVPGLGFSNDFPIYRVKIEKQRYPALTFLGLYRKGNTKILYRQIMIQANSSLYIHLKNHTGLHLNGQLVYKRTNVKGWSSEIGAGIGILQAFLPTTYEFDASGQLKKKIIAGRTFITNIVSYSLNKTLNKETGSQVFIKPSFYLIYPYNHTLMVDFSIEIGLKKYLFTNPFKKK